MFRTEGVLCCYDTSHKWERLSTKVAMTILGGAVSDVQGGCEEAGAAASGLATRCHPPGVFFLLPCFKVGSLFSVGLCACAHQERCTPKLFLLPRRLIDNLNMAGPKPRLHV